MINEKCHSILSIILDEEKKVAPYFDSATEGTPDHSLHEKFSNDLTLFRAAMKKEMCTDAQSFIAFFSKYCRKLQLHYHPDRAMMSNKPARIKSYTALSSCINAISGRMTDRFASLFWEDLSSDRLKAFLETLQKQEEAHKKQMNAFQSFVENRQKENKKHQEKYECSKRMQKELPELSFKNEQFCRKFDHYILEKGWDTLHCHGQYVPPTWLEDFLLEFGYQQPERFQKKLFTSHTTDPLIRSKIVRLRSLHFLETYFKASHPFSKIKVTQKTPTYYEVSCFEKGELAFIMSVNAFSSRCRAFYVKKMKGKHEKILSQTEDHPFIQTANTWFASLKKAKTFEQQQTNNLNHFPELKNAHERMVRANQSLHALSDKIGSMTHEEKKEDDLSLKVTTCLHRHDFKALADLFTHLNDQNEKEKVALSLFKWGYPEKNLSPPHNRQTISTILSDENPLMFDLSLHESLGLEKKSSYSELRIVHLNFKLEDNTCKITLKESVSSEDQARCSTRQFRCFIDEHDKLVRVEEFSGKFNWLMTHLKEKKENISETFRELIRFFIAFFCAIGEMNEEEKEEESVAATWDYASLCYHTLSNIAEQIAPAKLILQKQEEKEDLSAS